MAFKIEDGLTMPAARQRIPDYDIPFKDMKVGQSILLPYAEIPVEHARGVVTRFMRRNEEAVLVTRTEMKGDKEIGLRVWRQADKASTASAAVVAPDANVGKGKGKKR